MTRVFLDANIFIYFATDEEPYASRCQPLFTNIEKGKITGFTSVLVLNEVIHKLMLLELAEKKDLEPHKVIQQVRKDSNILNEVEETWEDLLRILSINNLNILDIDIATLIGGANTAQRNAFLITDSMHIATMKMYGIYTMVTTDSRMKKLKEISIWDPSEDTFSSQIKKDH